MLLVVNIVERIYHKTKIVLGKEIDWSEHWKSFGDVHPDKTFYVIRRCDKFAGVNSHFISVMGHIRYAVLNGWTPVVDMKNYQNALLDEKKIGIYNAWEYYFKQPCICSLDEVYQSKNVILSEGMPPKVYPNDNMEFFTRPDLIWMWHRYFVKYVGFSEVLHKKIEEKHVQYFKGKENDRILGIFLRGTDYVTLKPYEHPVQPTVQEAIKKASKVMKEQECRWLFLVTEDQRILDAFCDEFADCLIYIKEQPRYGEMSSGEHIAEYSFHRENDKYLKGMECMIQIGLLMKCNCFIGGRTSGCVAAMVMQPYYDYTYFWNLGRYGIDDVIDEV